MPNLSGKRVLVVGGETKAGRSVAVGLAEHSADVAIVSLAKETKAEFAVNSALNELWALGRQGVALAIDASDAEELAFALAHAEETLGALDAIVVVAEGAAVAVDALAGRSVIDIAAGTPSDEALSQVAGVLGA